MTNSEVTSWQEGKPTHRIICVPETQRKKLREATRGRHSSKAQRDLPWSPQRNPANAPCYTLILSRTTRLSVRLSVCLSETGPCYAALASSSLTVKLISKSQLWDSLSLQHTLPQLYTKGTNYINGKELHDGAGQGSDLNHSSSLINSVTKEINEVCTVFTGEQQQQQQMPRQGNVTGEGSHSPTEPHSSQELR